ncbi:DUF2147 domain-containing protein [Sulfitobacter pseudonitzschiae]|nr:DUF2147 domain-containing protein [Pseudosulfitobacter pseudonitzschiae]MBM1842101.1 DUF2147 domain-containing protein [Pseudosulfitobacter pseudonitzschiae]MBM1851810.1 DUF2147 domain-containing protein [Pseudosulfitobacter pseudonitzschiae]MBM1856649.1 DUF2147 domain-containing protein [Pseudosulfitobacter pseudonitzschiae]MBM1861509.1 DUF2147 domain-containing protein [Pseudosulfitobacter pseudonitzschiae]
MSNVSAGKMPRLGPALFGGALALWAGAVQAGSPVGTWLTEPDKKGQTAHVVAKPCGQALCGTITRAFDAQGNPIAHPNVGKRLFWDMVPQGDVYAGRAFVPAHNREYDGTLKVSGAKMTVKGCLGPVCQSQTWHRVD